MRIKFSPPPVPPENSDDYTRELYEYLFSLHEQLNLLKKETEHDFKI